MRAGRTVAARDAGLVVGLLVLTPIFVHDLDAAPKKALPKVATTLFAAPLDNGTKLGLGVRMLAIYNKTPGGQLPDLDPAFAATRQNASPQTRAALGPLQTSIEDEIQRVVTHSFRRSLLFSRSSPSSCSPCWPCCGSPSSGGAHRPSARARPRPRRPPPRRAAGR